MRTTVRVYKQLRLASEQRAAASGQTLAAVLEQALRELQGRPPRAARPAPVRLKTVGGGGVRAGVDLDDKAAMLDLMSR